jgi:hypothetical protein
MARARPDCLQRLAIEPEIGWRAADFEPAFAPGLIACLRSGTTR